jgi:hypothetical protein
VGNRVLAVIHAFKARGGDFPPWLIELDVSFVPGRKVAWRSSAEDVGACDARPQPRAARLIYY